MLLADDVLLLLTTDDDGRNTMGMMADYLLAGAVLADLALAGNVRLTEKGEQQVRANRVVVVPDAPWPADPLLAHALTTLAGQAKWFPRTTVEKLRPNLRRAVYDRLVRVELVSRDESRVLGLFPVTHHPALDPRYEAALLGRLDEVLLFGREPDERVAALIALLHAGNVLIKVVDRGRQVDRRAVKARAKALLDQYWTAAVTYRVIQSVQVAAASAAATT